MLEEQIQNAQTHSSPTLVFERMIQAANRHDLEAMVACFAPDHRSEQPFHPERDFTGQAPFARKIRQTESRARRGQADQL